MIVTKLHIKGTLDINHDEMELKEGFNDADAKLTVESMIGMLNRFLAPEWHLTVEYNGQMEDVEVEDHVEET